MSSARITRPATPEVAIAAALAGCATSVEAVAHGRWAFGLSSGTGLVAHASVDAGWLLLDVSLGGWRPLPAHAWQLLRWNTTLGGGVRLAVRPDRPGVCALAEVPLDDAVDLPRRVLEACAGLEAAHEKLACDPERAGDTPASRPGDGDVGDLCDLCRETGWDVVEREPGRFAVDLDAPEAFRQAVVETRGCGVAVTVPLAESTGHAPAPPAPLCRQALGLFLVRMCGIVRMARVAAETRDGAVRARFEVVFGSRPCAIELAHAFAALSVGCRLAARESAVLWSDEKIAGAYLSL